MNDTTTHERTWGLGLLAGCLLTSAVCLRLLGGAFAPPQPQPVDLNRAEVAELRSVPGIGATSAAAIVSARPLSSVDQLGPLVGPSAYAQARPWVCVGAE